MKIIPCEQIDISHPSRYKVKEISKDKIVLIDIKWDEEKIIKISFFKKLLIFSGLISIDYKRLFDIEESLLEKSKFIKTNKNEALKNFNKTWKNEASSVLNDNSCFNTLICEWNKKYQNTDFNWYMNPYVLIVK
ncbi:hypothetical protein ACOL3H_07115 [Aliarcobacter butzleri]